MIVLSSDGLARTSDACLALTTGTRTEDGPAGVIDGLVAAAVARDHGRPSADMAAIAIQIVLEESDVAIERGRMIRPVRAKANRL